MSQQIDLPNNLYNRLRRVADEHDRSVQDIVLDHIRIMYEEPQILLEGDTLDEFGDEALWMVVRREARKEQSRARELIAQSKERSLSQEEDQELDKLLAILDQYTLLRSKALAILNQRGYETAHFFE